METKIEGPCGECKWMGAFWPPMAAYQCGKMTHSMPGVDCSRAYVLPDFHGCPRFERREDWADKAWKEFCGDTTQAYREIPKLFRKAAEAEFTRRREEQGW